MEAVSDAADVTSVVEDLLAVAPGEETEIADAEVVEESEDLYERVRAALAEVPGSGSVQVESDRGIVWLRGELERPEAIAEAERRAASVTGVAEVRNLLHLPGTRRPCARSAAGAPAPCTAASVPGSTSGGRICFHTAEPAESPPPGAVGNGGTTGPVRALGRIVTRAWRSANFPARARQLTP